MDENAGAEQEREDFALIYDDSLFGNYNLYKAKEHPLGPIN